MISIAEGTKVKLHFSLALQGDTCNTIISTFDGNPAELVIGDGNLPAGFECCLSGMQSMQEKTFTISPENAFGKHNPGDIKVISRNRFSHDISLQEGLAIMFTDTDKQELPGVVTCFDDTCVTIDFNHPLAGQTLLFRVRILDVTASKCEIITTDKPTGTTDKHLLKNG